MTEDLAALGRSIVDGSDYLTLATADAGGVPWATPVWFAHEGFTTFVWVSRPTARHSLNIAARPEVAITVFDSTSTPGQGRGAYFEAVACPVGGEQIDRHLATFSSRSVGRGMEPWTIDDVTKPDGLRLHTAEVTAQWVLDDRDRRVVVDLADAS